VFVLSGLRMMMTVKRHQRKTMMVRRKNRRVKRKRMMMKVIRSLGLCNLWGRRTFSDLFSNTDLHLT